MENKFFKTICCFAFLFIGYYCNADKYTIEDLINIEEFTYYTKDSIPIQSTLYLPKKEQLKRIIIQLQSIQIEFRNPDFSLRSDSVHHKDILELVSSGTGVILISTRFRQTVDNAMILKNQTMETLADDVEYAYRYLRRKPQFSHIPIGVSGSSATGVAAAKVASRNTSVDFAILISTPSTPSIEEADYKWVNHPETSGVPYYKMLFAEFRKFFPHDRFTYKGQERKDSINNSINQQFEDCAWECISSINHTIISKYDEYDSIQYHAKKIFKNAFNTENLSKKIEMMNLLNKMEEHTANDYVDILMWFWYSPQDIDYLKWNPECYYPKINCPVLMLFAEKDINIDVNGSIENSKRIVEKYNKKNFSIVVIPGVDHSFYIPNEKITIKENNGQIKTLNKRTDLFFNTISNWIKTISLNKNREGEDK
jgi:hypothetical protein